MVNIGLLANTMRYLKPVQVYYRVGYFLRRKLNTGTHFKEYEYIKQKDALIFNSSVRSPRSYYPYRSFDFLNVRHSFPEKIDWNNSEHGRLWAYNLNYFDFLLQEDISLDEGRTLINEFIGSINQNLVGVEPYPVSLRVMNWIKFFVRYQISSRKYDATLWEQLKLLSKNKEYHLLGNHLLENAFALLFGAYYFNDADLYRQARRILNDELDEQILQDGAHFELSPMYHCLMTHRILDCYNLVISNALFGMELSPILKSKAVLMLSFLDQISYRNGNIPLLNDSAFGIAPSPEDLFSYARNLNLELVQKPLSDSGYRKFVSNDFEFLMDVGAVGPTYQPGHAHADTLSFELYIHDRPVIVDTGTSTYDMNETRSFERSTSAHNTVTINGENSSEVWASHRVGKRANVKLAKDDRSQVVASHDGYLKRHGVHHTRSVSMSDASIKITDNICEKTGTAHFHFAPKEAIKISGNEAVGKDFKIVFANSKFVNVRSSHYSPEFNKRIENKELQVSFDGSLVTHIIFQ